MSLAISLCHVIVISVSISVLPPTPQNRKTGEIASNFCRQSFLYLTLSYYWQIYIALNVQNSKKLELLNSNFSALQSGWKDQAKEDLVKSQTLYPQQK